MRVDVNVCNADYVPESVLQTLTNVLMKEYNLRINRESGKVNLSTIEQEKKMKNMYMLKNQLIAKLKTRRNEYNLYKSISNLIYLTLTRIERSEGHKQI